jgi:ubiquinone/menaquinone biosynthesis C-methylase UbiE
MILQMPIDPGAQIIDVGGGASTLVDDLLIHGFKHLTVLDISQEALNVSKARLGEKANEANWIESDITKANLALDHYDVWHDRAVFHFLNCAEDRKKYVQLLSGALKLGGHVVMAVFGPEGPVRCSGLDVIRYSPETLHAELGHDFKLIKSFGEDHKTPFGTAQSFIYCHFIRNK